MASTRLPSPLESQAAGTAHNSPTGGSIHVALCSPGIALQPPGACPIALAFCRFGWFGGFALCWHALSRRSESKTRGRASLSPFRHPRRGLKGVSIRIPSTCLPEQHSTFQEHWGSLTGLPVCAGVRSETPIEHTAMPMTTPRLTPIGMGQISISSILMPTKPRMAARP